VSSSRRAASTTRCSPRLVAQIDFRGTSPQHDGNLNCPLAVTRSASYFVVRCVSDPDVPASGRAFAPVAVRAPLGSLLNPRPPAAVAAGNVETSCRVVDVLFRALRGALDLPAEGQGTMNNITFGNERFTYYETLAGGQGACANTDGPSAVHVTMSNTLNTPIEALELEYPLRVRAYGLRRGLAAREGSAAATVWSVRSRCWSPAACR
jgi:N-methylhydantoinase B